MSTLFNSARAGTRTRVPRFAEAAVERARLTVVPPRRQLGRTQAARTPFAVLVLAMLAAGVVGLLMFNTNMQQASFKATDLQDKVNVGTAKKQSLDMELDQLRDPQRLAVAAKALGMVAPAQPAFIQIGDGSVLGNPTPATSGDAVRINPLPAELPDSIKPRTVIAKPSRTAAQIALEKAQRQAQKQAQNQAQRNGQRSLVTDTPGTSTNGARQGDRKKASTQANSGATR